MGLGCGGGLICMAAGGAEPGQGGRRDHGRASELNQGASFHGVQLTRPPVRCGSWILPSPFSLFESSSPHQRKTRQHTGVQGGLRGVRSRLGCAAPGCGCTQAGLFFSLPLGSTEVMGAIGRSDATGVLGADVSFFGFLASFSVRWSPFAIEPPVD